MNSPLLASLTERLGWTLFHSLWQFALIAIVLCLIVKAMKRRSPHQRYLIQCAALVLMVVAACITFCIVEIQPLETAYATPQSDNGHDSRSPTPLSNGSEAERTSPMPAGLGLPTVRAELEVTNEHFVIESQQATSPTRQPVGKRLRKWKHAASQVVAPWLPTMIAMWLVDVAAFSIRPAIGWISVRRLRIAGCSDVPPFVIDTASRVAQRMGMTRAIQVVESTIVEVPTVIGWIRPLVLLPASAVTGLSIEQLEAVIAHELGHIRRFDYVVNALQVAMETLFFYHPAVWWVSHSMRLERELCCDEIAVGICGDRTSYAKLLLWLEETRGTAVMPSPALSSAGGSLMDRVRHVTNPQPGRTRSGGLIALGLPVMAIAVGGIWLSAVAGESVASSATNDPIREISKQIAASMPLNDWKTLECDEEANVDVDGYRGHRIVLRRSWKEFTDTPRQQIEAPNNDNSNRSFEMRHEDQEFVLIPIEPQKEQAPIELKTRIQWRESSRQHPAQDICLGEGLGFVWYARTPVIDQESVREKLKLTGGDDRIELLVRATLRKKGVDAPESYAAQRILGSVGDRAIPVINKSIQQAQADDDLWGVIGSLAFIKTNQSTKLLQQLFKSEDRDRQRAVAYALIHKPFRESAKETYLAMLKSRYSTEYVCDVCVEFGWKDALPILNELIAAPSNLSQLSYMIRARRSLNGSPIDEALLDAAKVLRSDRDNQESKQLLIDSEDAEAATLLAIELATFTAKGNSGHVNSVGFEILKARPRPQTVAILQGVIDGLPADQQKPARELLNVVTGQTLEPDTPTLPNSTSPFETEISQAPSVYAPDDHVESANQSLLRAMQFDPTFSKNSRQPISQQQAISTWQAFLQGDNLSQGQQIFAWWRIGSLAAYNFDPSRQEKADWSLAAEAMKKVHELGDELICMETLNAATVFGGLAGKPDERAVRLATAYRWLFTRTDQMVRQSGSRVNKDCRILEFDLTGGMRLKDVAARREFLQQELARCRDVITRRITDEIQYSQHPDAIASLLAAIRDVADQDQLRQWQELASKIETSAISGVDYQPGGDNDRLVNELAQQMQDFRRQLQADKNSKASVAIEIEKLLKRHPESKGVIHRLAAHTYGQSNIRNFAAEVTLHAELALPLERDSVERSRLYMYLSNAAEVSGRKSLASDWYLKGLLELQPYDLPAVAPELPSVGKYRGLLNPGSPDDPETVEKAERFEILQAAEMKWRKQAKTTRDLAGFRKIFVDGLRRMNGFPNNLDARARLKQRVRELLEDESLVKLLLDALAQIPVDSQPSPDIRLEGSEVTPEAIERLAGRQWNSITLADAQFNGAIIERLRHVSSIQSLRLYGEGLSGQIPRLENVQGLTSLEIDSRLLLRDVEAIGKLTQLERLTLPQGLALTVTGAKQIAKLTNLKALRLYNLDIDDASFVELRTLTQLEDLSLGHTRVTDEGLKVIEQMPNMRVLDLIRYDHFVPEQVTDACIPSILRLKKLERLTLSGKITGEGLRQIAKAPNLKTLVITFTDITAEGLVGLQDSNIETLTISPSQIGSAPNWIGIENLKKCKSLKHVTVNGQPTGKEAEWQRILTEFDWAFES